VRTLGRRRTVSSVYPVPARWRGFVVSAIRATIDRYLLSRPWLTSAVVAAVSLHLLNLLPKPIDPLYHLRVWAGR
jgi:hypothetical protein